MNSCEIFISYIIPCYNVEKYLIKCMESLANQTIKEGVGIEYIFINDGSIDDTLRLLNEFAANDRRAKVINQSNQGVCIARNNGLSIARGEYVFFLDGDDFLTDEASQLIYDQGKKKADIIIANEYRVNEDCLEVKQLRYSYGNTQPGTYTISEFFKIIDKLPIAYKVYKRETLINNSITFDEDLKVGEMLTYFIHALAFSKYITLSNGVMANYVCRSGGATTGFNIERDSLIIDTMHRIDKYAGYFSFDVKAKESYFISLYAIVNVFSFYKYPKLSKYTPEIGRFLQRIRKDEIYSKTLQFFIFKKPKLNRRCIDVVFLYFLPVRFYYFRKRLGL